MATYTPNYNLYQPDATDPFEDFRSEFNANMGIIDNNLGGGGGSSSLAGLSDVNLTTPTDGQVLTYDGNSSKWVNANGGGGGGGSFDYSTTEKVIGTWIDGKPLYQKTLSLPNLPNNGSINLTTPNNIKLLVDVEGVIYSTIDSTYQRPLPFPADGGNQIRVDINNSILRIVTYADWSLYVGYLTIRYTKTTD